MTNTVYNLQQDNEILRDVMAYLDLFFFLFLIKTKNTKINTRTI